MDITRERYSSDNFEMAWMSDGMTSRSGNNDGSFVSARGKVADIRSQFMWAAIFLACKLLSKTSRTPSGLFLLHSCIDARNSPTALPTVSATPGEDA